MTPLFDLNGVSVARGGRTILDGISLRLDPGDRLALVGANGAGKTTLLRTLVGLERQTAGQIVAFGAERRIERDFREVRARAGFLFQDPDDQLFAPTVIEDVAFGPLNLGLDAKAATGRAMATLDRLGLLHLASRITHHLSGGEKRLVSLATVLAMEPQALLLDEPTNALDPAHLERLTALLMATDMAMIVVSHDHGFLERLTDRALLLQGGCLAPATLHRHRHVSEHVHVHPGEEPHDHVPAG
ncbi:energy-coupling factor ABC transporter ATP-binding protein [Consotaella aegiceratis]|uniref:energy-coupling factor ABC transporter ATP-binding protein n=1 Tax=Consotaella aegiceratis TaxID=3097961 RepID=UPI002F3F57D3